MQRKIFYSFILVIAIPTLSFCFILLNICGRLIEERTLDASVVVIQESVKRIENRLNDYHRMTMQVYFNLSLMASLADRSGSAEDRERVFIQTREILKSFVNSDRHLVSASITGDDFSIIEGSDFIDIDSMRARYAEDVHRAGGRLVWIPTTPLSTIYGLDSRYFGAIRSLRIDGESFGTLLLLVRENFFRDDEAGELPMKGSRDYIVTTKGRLVSALDQEKVGTILNEPFFERVLMKNSECFVSENGNHYIVHQKSELTDWIFIRLLERDMVLRHFRSLRESLFILIGLFLIFLLFLSFALSNGLAKPLAKLTRQIDFFGEGNLTFSTDGIGSSSDEIDKLSKSVGSMALRINDLITKVAEDEQYRTTAELKALRQQLNPHFIYNTLNTIRWMAAVNRQVNIEETVMALIVLMRSASDMDRTFVTVEEELNTLRQYVLIQKKRYQDFRFESDVTDEALHAGINKFIIQPFVENSIIHGFKDKEDEGIVRLIIRKIDNENGTDRLSVCIKDNGCGFDPASITEGGGENDAANHIGIQNIHRRLELNYGSDYELDIKSSPGKGTQILFLIPWKNTDV